MTSDKTNRPKLKIVKSPKARYIELLTITMAFGSLFYLIYHFNTFPNQVPIHFNFTGDADKIGSKFILLIIPLLNVILAVGFIFFGKHPHLFNYPVNVTEENAASLYQIALAMLRTLGFLTALLLSYITFATVKTALGITASLNPYLLGTLTIGIFINMFYSAIKMNKFK